jgi:hypothetical protein
MMMMMMLNSKMDLRLRKEDWTGKVMTLKDRNRNLEIYGGKEWKRS